MQMCQVVEKEVSLFELQNKLTQHNSFKVLVNNCFTQISSDMFSIIFVDSEHTLNDDRYYLIKYCIEQYIKIKLNHIGTKLTEQQQSTKIRQKFNKLILFSGQ